jgi:hypothetical protein
MRRPALRADEGAKFFGRVDAVGDGQFRATCRAAIHAPEGVLDEAPEHFMTDDRDSGLQWVARRAAERGFDTWIDESPKD